MTYLFDRPVLVCDVDGCVVRSPSDDTIHDERWWMEFWEDVEGQEPNAEVVQILDILIRSGFYVIFLTGRPHKARKATLEMLRLHFKSGRIDDDQLITRPDDFAGDLAVWKGRTVEELVAGGYLVNLALEDYGPNVAELRKTVPVLRYEKLRNGAEGGDDVVS
jgi:hypothetical protein